MNPRIGKEPRPGRASLAWGATIFTLTVSGCAIPPEPVQQVAVTYAAIAQAETAGAPELAPVEMRVARLKLVRMNLAIADKDYRRALWLAQEAEVDAQLAEVKAWSATTSKAATSAVAESKQKEVLQRTDSD